MVQAMVVPAEAIESLRRCVICAGDRGHAAAECERAACRGRRRGEWAPSHLNHRPSLRVDRTVWREVDCVAPTPI
jgi:hypothetical protein